MGGAASARRTGGRERVFDIPEEPQRSSAPKPTHRAPRSSVSADPASSAPAGDSRLWTQLLDQFKGRLPVNHRVFLNMASGTVEGDCLTVHCRNDFVRDSLNNRTVLAVLEEVTSAAVGSPVRVMLTVGGETPSAPGSTRSAPKPPRPAPEQTPTPEEERPPLRRSRPCLRSHPAPGAESGGGTSPSAGGALGAGGERSALGGRQ